MQAVKQQGVFLDNMLQKKASHFCKANMNQSKWISKFIPQFISVQIKEYINSKTMT